MKSIPSSIQRLIREFNKLPGIGSKTSERFVFFLLRQPKSELDALAQSILHLKEVVQTCTECFTVSESTLCSICADPKRNKQLVCVVAEPRDVMALEQGGTYTGVYHVLGGVIAPQDGVGPEQLRIQELADRIDRQHITEVILATNPDMEGETTAHYVAQQLQPKQILVTKIARGLPMGGNIEFADEVTLTSALNGRRVVE